MVWGLFEFLIGYTQTGVGLQTFITEIFLSWEAATDRLLTVDYKEIKPGGLHRLPSCWNVFDLIPLHTPSVAARHSFIEAYKTIEIGVDFLSNCEKRDPLDRETMFVFCHLQSVATHLWEFRF